MFNFKARLLPLPSTWLRRRCPRCVHEPPASREKQRFGFSRSGLGLRPAFLTRRPQMPSWPVTPWSRCPRLCPGPARGKAGGVSRRGVAPAPGPPRGERAWQRLWKPADYAGFRVACSGAFWGKWRPAQRRWGPFQALLPASHGNRTWAVAWLLALHLQLHRKESHRLWDQTLLGPNPPARPLDAHGEQQADTGAWPRPVPGLPRDLM